MTAVVIMRVIKETPCINENQVRTTFGLVLISLKVVPLMKHLGTEHTLNPLTTELNSSAQRCLPILFTGDFNF
jgi:hypothetical protein